MEMIFLLKTNPRHVLHFQSESRLILDELAFTAAYGGLGEACGAKLTSLAFQGAFLIFATFSIFLRILKIDLGITKMKVSTKKSEKIREMEISFFAKSKIFFRVFVIAREGRLRVESFVKIGRGVAEL